MRSKSSVFLLAYFFLTSPEAAFSQAADFTDIEAEADYSKKVRDRDGFGFNYVETAQNMGFENAPQEYDGFGLLNEEQKKEN